MVNVNKILLIVMIIFISLSLLYFVFFKKIILSIFVIIICFILFLNIKDCKSKKDTSNETRENIVNYDKIEEKIKIHRFVSDVSDSPKILIIAGTHGNEQGPSIILNKKIKEGYFEGKNVIIIPSLNVWGLEKNIRFTENKEDVNRNYKKTGESFIENEIIKKLEVEADIILDFHEAYDFNRLNESSLGNTIIPLENEKSRILGEKLQVELNNNIEIKHKQYNLLLNKKDCEIPGTFRCYSSGKDKVYLLIELCRGETVGIPKQTLEERGKQVSIILDFIIK